MKVKKCFNSRLGTPKMFTVHRREMIPDRNCDLYKGIQTNRNGRTVDK